ncbi:hypothetical protein D3C76_481610 [compost metagenome]
MRALVETRGHGIDDRRATLVQAVQVDVLGAQLAGLEQLLQVRRHFDQGEVVDLAAVHEELAVGGTQVLGACTITAEQRLAELPGSIFAHPGRGGGVAEQHGGVAVLWVDDLRVGVGGNQQAILQARCLHEALHRIQPIYVAGAAQGNIERRDMRRQPQLVLDDRRRVRQAFGIAVLSDHDQRIDGCRVKRGIGSEQRPGRLDTQVGGFLGRILARQEGRTDLAEDEILILAEFRTLRVVIHAFYRYVTGDAFDANHCGFPMEMAKIRRCRDRECKSCIPRRRDYPQTQ